MPQKWGSKKSKKNSLADTTRLVEEKPVQQAALLTKREQGDTAGEMPNASIFKIVPIVIEIKKNHKKNNKKMNLEIEK